MNAIAWLMLGNIILLFLLLLAVYQASKLAGDLEDLTEKNFTRMASLLEECLELKERKK